MKTLGVDLSAEPPDTAWCLLDWRTTPPSVEVSLTSVGDASLLLLLRRPDVDRVGIDVPFGWPRAFVSAVGAHAAGEPWPGRGQEPAKAFRRGLSLRVTDEVVRGETGLTPLSVSTDRIGVAAFRGALLLDALAADGQPVARDGSGRLAEVYPAAALVRWLPSGPAHPEPAHRGYKRREGQAARARLLKRLDTALGWALPRAARRECLVSDHVFDAFLCALIARAVELGETLAPRDDAEREAARVEGWIHVPSGGSLRRLS